jgi:putative membrane protein
MENLLFHIIANTLGIWLASRFITGVEFNGSFQYLLLAGVILGLISFFIKPVLKLITLPLRILTLGLFGIVLNMLLIWLLDVFFVELVITGIVPLFWMTLLIWGSNTILGVNTKKNNHG